MAPEAGPGRRKVPWWPAAIVVAWGIVVGGTPLLFGPPNGDDAYYHAMYALEHARCWRGGVLLPGWYPDLNAGLGGPEPRARPQLPLALHAAFALVLDDAVAATSLATALIPAAAGLLMLSVARRRGVPTGAALFAAVLWCGSPYLALSLHERAALQEAWAIALLPWLLDAFLPPAPASRSDVVRGGIALAVAMATQLLVAFMAGLVIVAAHALARERRPLRVAAAGALGAGLAAFSWVPNVLGLQRLQGETFATGWFDWRQRFLLSASDPAPDLNRHLSLVAAAVVVAAALLASHRGRPRALAAGAVAAVLLATRIAAPLWGVAPGFDLLQFPWRWLGPASALAVLAVTAAPPGWRRVAAGCVLALPLAGALTWAPRLPAGPPLRPSRPERAAQAATRYGVAPILPPFPAMIPRGVNLSDALRAAEVVRRGLPAAAPAGPRKWAWRVEGREAGVTALPLLADDGWRVSLDGRAAAWKATHGLVGVATPAGECTVTAVQVLLPEAWLGLALSAATALAWFGWSRRRPSAVAAPPAQRPGGVPA